MVCANVGAQVGARCRSKCLAKQLLYKLAVTLCSLKLKNVCGLCGRYVCYEMRYWNWREFFFFFFNLLSITWELYLTENRCQKYLILYFLVDNFFLLINLRELLRNRFSNDSNYCFDYYSTKYFIY